MQARVGIRARVASPQQRANADGSSMHLSKLADASLPFSSSTIGSDASIANSSAISAKSPACRSLDLDADVLDGPVAARGSLPLPAAANKLNRSDSEPMYVGAYRELSACESDGAGEGAAAGAEVFAAANVDADVVLAPPPTPSQSQSQSSHMRSLDITGILGTPCTDRDRSALVDELPCRDWHDATPADEHQRVSLAASVSVARPGPRGAWAERARQPLVLKSELDKGGVRCDVSNLFNNSD